LVNEHVRVRIERACATVVVGGVPVAISADDALPEDVCEAVRGWLAWWGTADDLIVIHVEGGVRIERPPRAPQLVERAQNGSRARRWTTRARTLATSRWLWLP
jgi:hypothetical protein